MKATADNKNSSEESKQLPIDTLIIGQGISGTFLSWYLLKKQKRVLVIDMDDSNSPSRVAAGIINPVTGRRHVTVWMAEEIIPFVIDAYKQLGHESGMTLLNQKAIIDFFPSPQMRLSFLQRLEEDDTYLHSFPEQNHFNSLFNYDFGCGEIRPAYSVNMEGLLSSWRNSLKAREILVEENFDLKDLRIEANHISYRNIEAKSIIFCDGIASAKNYLFEALPFAPNKGEALIVKIEELPDQRIYKKGMMLVPLSEEGLFWWGSDYQWEFEQEGPTEAFRHNSEWSLRQWLKLPFTIVDHLASIRPATIERRPFVGMHPHYPSVGILNGMGTKGCSLAPFFAFQLAEHLCDGLPILPEASIARFSKLLSRSN